MTSEQPPGSSRQPRPGVAARRSALGIDGGGDPPPLKRESLRDSLARIPDLPRAGRDAPRRDRPNPPHGAGPAAGEGSRLPSGPTPRRAGGEVLGEGGGPTQPPPGGRSGAAGRSRQDGARRRVHRAGQRPSSRRMPQERLRPLREDGRSDSGRRCGPRPGPSRRCWSARGVRRRSWSRLIAAIPVLGCGRAPPHLGEQGRHLQRRPPDAGRTPGFEAQVEPTPTAVAIQYDDDNMPNAVTFLRPSGPDGGGSVIFVPLDTEVQEPRPGVDRSCGGLRGRRERPALARRRLAVPGRPPAQRRRRRGDRSRQRGLEPARGAGRSAQHQQPRRAGLSASGRYPDGRHHAAGRPGRSLPRGHESTARAISTG